MCGFIAVASSVRHSDFQLAQESLRHRGLSNAVYYLSGHYIAHHLLHIATAEPVHQPVLGPNFAFVFAGEILNFREVDKYASDTEMLFHHVLEETFVKNCYKYTGFWSWALLTADGGLVAATDYLGHKPVYYRTDMNAVASEPEALANLAPCTMDLVHFANIQKWGYDATGRTGWDEIKQLPPGYMYDDGAIYPYWFWEHIQKSSDSLYVLLERSIKDNLLAERRTAMLLSGGLDSSIVYTMINELGHHIDAYHVENDEEQYIQDLCSDYTKVELSSVSQADAVRAHQSPVDLGSVIPQLALSNALKGNHVVLTGDGADELFGGYGRNERYDSRQSDTFVELPYYHHPRLDRLMMRNTIELRSPFSNSPELVKYALSLPHETGKKIMIREFRHLLPDSILKREKLALRTKNYGLENTQKNIAIFRGIYER